MGDKQRIFWFDLIRGLSAVLVCLGHLRSVFFCDYNQIQTKQLWHLPFYFVSCLGHQAVIVFFVLSGFFVGGSVLRNKDEFGWSGYLVARLSRLWTVLIPALAFTCLVDFSIAQVDPGALKGKYLEAWSSGPNADYSTSFFTLSANLFFLQTIVAPVYGSNGPLWSLANEFWYYVLFPLCVATFAPGLRWRSVFFVLLAACILWFLPTSIRYGFVVWLLGAVVFYVGVGNSKILNHIQRKIRWILPIGLALFVVALVFAKLYLERHSAHGADLVLGLAFSLFVVPLVDLRAPNRIVEKAAVWLSEISYSLYLFHFPIVVLIGAVVLEGQSQQPTLLLLTKYLLTLAGIIVAAYIFWYVFERNTDRVRKWMKFLLQSNRLDRSVKHD